ncbi:RNA methyltransferase [Kaistella jeonii]|uniref:RNA methyltransferase n=1 Tax=Kaistella jeonii TaxID=266749 RepID=A0A0C1FR32_9FLAO|nr:RNA methyltransferase [Kaistella jeonii]KIA90339.1 RNA methyltransferase [Kaistella jeonii]SFB74275.1 RNA methyltransferase, TrmH family [Kaistella jeonii]VEI95115.1 23S rRNA (guanosine-2'-O-)-methyltransferase RlmB [Kaistella jeonii]
MLTAHKIKILQSLDQKKFRQKYNLFLVEGNKTVKEIPFSEYKIKEIFSVNPDSLSVETSLITEILPSELKKISFLQHPKDSVAVCELKEERILENDSVQIILDGIQDPGNLGTIIRLADWFGISQIICSEDTVDFYNPKVIQASMGSFLRVNLVYQNLESYLSNCDSAIIGTDMDGESFYDYSFPKKFNLVMGNEGNGIRPEIEKLLTDKITIPRFGKSQATESLNVSMATGIILGQIFNKK